MSYRGKLFGTRDMFDTEGTDSLFLAAMRENCRFQYEHCPQYKQILDAAGFSPDMLREYKDIEKLPFIPTMFLKNHQMFSMPMNRLPIKATSSGTSGKQSRIGMDTGSLFCGLKMVLKAAYQRDLLSPVPVNYIILGYKPHKGNETAVTKTAYGYTFFAPALSRTFAIKYNDGGYAPDLEGVLKAVKKSACSPFPVRFMGFPSYTYFMLKMMEEQNVRLKMPKGSGIMLGGGWKQFYRERVEKEVLYDLAEKILGISEENIVESFGAAEHPILYLDCKNHHFHIPVYSRVIIRDVNTLEPLEYGQAGLVNLVTPMIMGTPLLSVMTDDLGIVHNDKCGCGINSPYLEIIGRVGMSEIKTCAAGAADLLDRGI